MTISLKSKDEIKKMRVAGRMAAEVLELIGDHVVPGVSTETLKCNDYQFMQRVYFVLKNVFKYEPLIDIETFFNLVAGNQKM